ncbi:MAG: DNA polymerase I [Candidatus Omnitrophica bacterium]|nr:DNA polymerase I [Candidatus Omnitrophota bacterium]
MSARRVFLIDGHAFCYRAFFAVRELRNSKGRPTNAVFGFLNILRKIRKDFNPEYMAVCFDSGKKTHRHAAYAEYKIQRPSMPEDLAAQLPVIKELVRAYRISIFEREGEEADDIIATLARRFRGAGCEVVIASDDKDMYQLVGEGVSVYSSRRDALMGPKEAAERFGIVPGHMVDYLALAGDSSDNIPGVDGIGEVTARKLVSEYGGLEDILRQVDKLPVKLRERLEHGRESALLSRELATLNTAVPLDCELADIKIERPDTQKLSELFRELEFRGFADELAVECGQPEVAAAVPDKVESGEDAGELVREALASGVLSCVLLYGDQGGEGHPVAACLFGGRCAYSLSTDRLADIREALVSAKVKKIFYGYKDARKLFDSLGLRLGGEILDVQLAGYLLKSGQAQFSIEALSGAYLNVAPGESADRAPREAAQLALLQAPLEKALHDEKLFKLYAQTELPLSEVLADMEREGVRIDTDFLGEMSVSCARMIEEMTGKIYALAGGEFNLNSPKQLGGVLFERLKLPVVKRTKTGPSTDEEVLTRLASKHELPALILEYRGLAKLKSTYIDALPRMVDPRTGRVHCSFNQTGTETGRLSSNHPNLQNIPVRTELGRRIRRAFVPSEDGRVLLSADYSQVELRVLAHLADEPGLKRAFENGEDIHSYTAGLMFDVPQEKVTPEMRYNAKRINFGIVYGMSAFGLAKDLGVPQKEAQAFIDTYFARYPGIRTFMEREIARTRERGYVETILGRRRYLPDINSRNPAVRQFAERQAVNTPVQGTAADIIKVAMVALQKELTAAKLAARMIITVHDELVFDVPLPELKKVAGLVRRTMENATLLSVPLNVTVKAGVNWAELRSLGPDEVGQP